MKIETYEKYISELEDENDSLRHQLEDAANRERTATSKATAKQEKVFRDLLLFLTNISSTLSTMQSQILDASVQVNKQLASVSGTKFEEMAKGFKDLLAISATRKIAQDEDEREN